ncbi:hypothetical protein [Methanobrevibacter millerae]|uniref:Uncharacterized protein n=1 Tax=Methanobrevibacter millerae TaxID=230361 RepID=A0A1G5WVM6_9EURY|nr:hypothetical protein [Methanobrevibacter millerae]SDA61726.1 hypothetical protein SAMN02910315_01703 [Methanobrevibacter millerae]
MKESTYSDKTNNSKENILKEYIINLESLIKKEKEDKTRINKQLNKYQSINERLDKENKKIEKKIIETESKLTNLKKDYDILLNERDDLNKKVIDKTQENTALNTKLNQLKTQQHETNIKYDMLKCSYKNLKENNNTLKNKEKEILSSKSWKITSPLRKISNMNKKK